MRQLIFQQQLGQTNIADMIISNDSRDDIPNILKGLQFIYSDEILKKKLFDLLKSVLSKNQLKVGRAGMNMWSIYVMAMLRVNLNWDYDRLQHMVNEHKSIRTMLGHDGEFDSGYQYPLQTIKDNLKLLTPEVVDETPSTDADEDAPKEDTV